MQTATLVRKPALAASRQQAVPARFPGGRQKPQALDGNRSVFHAVGCAVRTHPDPRTVRTAHPTPAFPYAERSLRPRLRLGAPDDEAEHQAERIAERATKASPPLPSPALGGGKDSGRRAADSARPVARPASANPAAP